MVPFTSTLSKEEKEEWEEKRKREREEAEKEGFVVEGKDVEAEGVAVLHRAAVKFVVVVFFFLYI